jgi:hypothetical protein
MGHPISPRTQASTIASDCKGAESPKVQPRNLPALVGKCLQGEAKGRHETPVVHRVTTVARPGDVEHRLLAQASAGQGQAGVTAVARPGEGTRLE